MLLFRESFGGCGGHADKTGSSPTARSRAEKHTHHPVTIVSFDTWEKNTYIDGATFVLTACLIPNSTLVRDQFEDDSDVMLKLMSAAKCAYGSCYWAACAPTFISWKRRYRWMMMTSRPRIRLSFRHTNGCAFVYCTYLARARSAGVYYFSSFALAAKTCMIYKHCYCIATGYRNLMEIIIIIYVYIIVIHLRGWF